MLVFPLAMCQAGPDQEGRNTGREPKTVASKRSVDEEVLTQGVSAASHSFSPSAGVVAHLGRNILIASPQASVQSDNARGHIQAGQQIYTHCTSQTQDT